MPEAGFDLGLSYDGCIAFTDDELVEKTYDTVALLVDDLEAENVDTISDSLYLLVGEILERFAPHVARAEIVRNDGGDPNNILDALNGLRQRQAARLLRDTLKDGDDA